MWFALCLAILVKLLIETENPLLCAGFFTALVSIGQIVALALGVSVLQALTAVLASFALSYAYFWLLNRIEAGSGPWWFVLAGGALVAYFL